ncbi:hypothetical protein [Enhygromyxa salina]|uniref:BNR repeat domain protein n=1 Tax=Enhygromyxa salina TaxID=215803 RepID=A0A2S9XFP2_9BACT|nr:hypothetical protein [Enhygromyxa salina]PRP91679.1 hypothetical protein ENSA7_81900 [Enhygromyxa salina]
MLSTLALCACSGEPTSDGDPTGDGDGDATVGETTSNGDGDGDPGDGDPGDGDPGDGDGDPGDGDGDGDGDGQLVGVFVAQGSLGRSTLSCDDGQTWIKNRSYDLDGSIEVCDEVASVACFADPCSLWQFNDQQCEMQAQCDCDHNPGADLGLAFGNGVFVATWGWGPPGAIKASVDGFNWAVAVEPTTQAGVAFGNGTFVAAERTMRVSADGYTWSDGGEADFRNQADEVIWNARDIGFADVAGGVFVAGASSGNGSDLMISKDAGQTWTRPAGSWACGGDFKGVAGGNDVIVVVFGEKVCRSSDGGDSFELAELAGGAEVVFDGVQFVSWRDGGRWVSSDGASWTSTDLVIEGLPQGHGFALGPVARSEETGTYVSVREGWQVWYEAQDFYRSGDGVTWEVLSAGSFAASHRIRHIAYGWVDAVACE